MKCQPRFLLLAVVGTGLLFATGCASRTSKFGRETIVAGGLVDTKTHAYEAPKANSIDIDVSKMTGQGVPTGKTTTILWGLITLHDT